MTPRLAPFDRLDEATFRRLWTLGVERPGRPGRTLWWQGDPADGVGLVIEGRFRQMLVRSDDTTLDAGTFGPGDWLGLAEVTVRGPRLTDTLALEPGTIRVFSTEAWRRMVSHPEVAGWLTVELARQCYGLHGRLDLAPPGPRLARWLGAQPPGWIVGTQDDWAANLGLRRETVNRHLGRLQDEGLIEVARGRVRVVDPEGLAGWG